MLHFLLAAGLPNTTDLPPQHMPSFSSHSAASPRRRSALRCGVLAVVASIAAVLLVDAGPASALELRAPLETNALAPFVAVSATDALDSFDAYRSSGDLASYGNFVRARTQTARLAATELGYPEAEMISAWASTPLEHQRAVLAAMTQVGVPYRRNTSSEGVGFDCSGLTTYAWAEPGVTLYRQSGSQISEAERLDRSTAKAGDLVHYPGHVMIYLGVGDAIIHSVKTGRTVELDTISDRRSSSVRFGDPST